MLIGLGLVIGLKALLERERRGARPPEAEMDDEEDGRALLKLRERAVPRGTREDPPQPEL